MSALPAPLTTLDHDIEGFDGFLLNVQKLMASELWALATGDEFKAAVGLWCRAWTQKPHGSLPDNDKVLQAYSGAGPRWRKIKDMALRGFIKCSDGRLYHETLCEDVLRAACSKMKNAERTAAATAAKKALTEKKRNDKRDDGQQGNVTHSHRIEGNRKVDVIRSASEPLADLEIVLRQAAGWENQPAPNLCVTGQIQALIDSGAVLEQDVLPVIRSLAPRVRSPTSWNYFIKPIAQARDDRIGAAAIVSPPSQGGHRERNSNRPPPRSFVEEALAAGGLALGEGGEIIRRDAD